MRMSRVMRVVLTRSLSMLAAVLVAGAAHAQTISKCQDAEGNWHYGDFAAEACAEDANVTELDERGVKIKELEAPPTQEELEAQQAAARQEELEAERRARQQAEDRRLLHTYDSAQAIVNAREQRVTAINQELESHELFRQDLVDERQEADGSNNEHAKELDTQIEQYDHAIERLKEERRELVEQYDKELKRYRKLTGQ